MLQMSLKNIKKRVNGYFAQNTFHDVAVHPAIKNGAHT